MTATWYHEIVGPTPFLCELCMATGPSAEPCPFHAHRTWAEWLTDALKEWAWSIRRALAPWRREDPDG